MGLQTSRKLSPGKIFEPQKVVCISSLIAQGTMPSAPCSGDLSGAPSLTECSEMCLLLYLMLGK
jgi:hypothetical protein